MTTYQTILAVIIGLSNGLGIGVYLKYTFPSKDYHTVKYWLNHQIWLFAVSILSAILLIMTF